MRNRKIDRYADLNEFIRLARKSDGSRFKKIEVAFVLGIRPALLSALLRPEMYRPPVTDELVGRVAGLLNQTPEYVSRLLRRVA